MRESNGVSNNLSHIDSHGKANMVDVTLKPDSYREAIAEGFVEMEQATLELIANNLSAKGDVLSVARIAGIQAAKKCADLIPLCHPLLLTKVDISFEINVQMSCIRIQALCKLCGNTGVEMEALTAVSIAAVTVFDMCKAVDPNMQIQGIKVLSKQGGKNGHWSRSQL